MPTPRVLVVDDHALDRKLLTIHLQPEGYDVETAEDGLEAWGKLQAEPQRYDVVLLDRTMPRMDGMQLLGKMKDDEELRMVPVILQTALAHRDQILEGIRAGAYYYLTKPYDRDLLLSVVRTAATDSHEIRELQKRVRRGLNVLSLLSEARFVIRTLDEARDLAGVLANACPDPESAVVGLTELLVEHGNLGITYEDKSKLYASGGWSDEVQRRLRLPENAGKYAEVAFEREDQAIRFVIRDQGTGFDWRSYLQVDPQRAFDTHGRGIAMANRLSFSHIEYRGRGNEVIGTIVCD
ncbi:MAG: response regulator receiver protein [Acidobacteria bacterium]|nr:MAG: response regulator receiver protein [Acidobacteriota bacterium]